MADWSETERNQILDELRRRSAVDPAFRQLALTDPAAAIAKVTTKPIPSGVSYKFVDNSGSTKTVPLPNPMPETEELSDLELERVAGGGNVSIGTGWNR